MSSEKGFKLDEYNEEQQVVILSNEPNILVRASAGSGKTHALIGAVLNYRQQNPNKRIDVITFTRAATAELRNRLAAEGVTDVNISTIHVWARDFLGIYSALYNFQLRLIYENDIRDILRGIIAGYKRKVEVDPVYKYICEGLRSNIPDRIKVTYDAIERRYIQYKRDNELYDFTDYPLYLYNVLVTFDEAINNIDALFVDEYQDVDETQFEIFQKVNANKKFFVGDAWQSIFVFRGADGAVFNKTKDFEEYKLVCNYRSYQEIIDYAVTVYLALQDKADFEETCYISEIM